MRRQDRTFTLRDASRVLNVEPPASAHMEAVEISALVGAIARVIGAGLAMAVFVWVALAVLLSFAPAVQP